MVCVKTVESGTLRHGIVGRDFTQFTQKCVEFERFAQACTCPVSA